MLGMVPATAAWAVVMTHEQLQQQHPEQQQPEQYRLELGHSLCLHSLLLQLLLLEVLCHLLGALALVLDSDTPAAQAFSYQQQS